MIFTSDNGPWLIKGTDGGSALPLRGGKGSTWEGGVRVPTLARWPQQIKAGSVCDAMAGTIDLLPTLVSLAGGKVATDTVIDGRDISPVLLSKTDQSPRETHYYFMNYQLQAVRQGPWKLALMKQPEMLGANAPTDTERNPRLYNLQTDLSERTDVSAQHPEIVQRLLEQAESMNAQIGGDAPSARRPAGIAANPTTLYPIQTEAPRRKAGTQAALQSIKPAALHKLEAGDKVAGARAPRIDNRPFTVSFRVETPASDAVLVAHGGIVAGFSVFLQEGQLAFAVRHGANEQVSMIVADRPLAGQAQVTARLKADLTMELMQEDQIVASGKAVRLIPKQPAEDLCLGHDAQMPVTAYPETAKFQGKLTGLTITSP